MGVLVVIAGLFLALGCVFTLTGSIGVLRMPDFYSRLHPAGKSDTLAQGLILFGLALLAGQQLIDVLTSEHAGEHGSEWIGIVDIMLKLALLSGLLFLTSPTSTHAIAKAARLDRNTRVTAEEQDAGISRVAEIVVVGDVAEPLSEAAGPTLDVHDGEPAPEPNPDTQAEDE